MFEYKLDTGGGVEEEDSELYIDMWRRELGGADGG